MMIQLYTTIKRNQMYEKFYSFLISEVVKYLDFLNKTNKEKKLRKDFFSFSLSLGRRRIDTFKK